jgi:hypothetical protein
MVVELNQSSISVPLGVKQLNLSKSYIMGAIYFNKTDFTKKLKLNYFSPKI